MTPEKEWLGLYQYKLVIKTDLHIAQSILNIRKDFAEKFRSAPYLNDPCIILAEFVHLEEVEKRIRIILKKVSDAHRSFLITIRDFGSLPAHSIFLKIETQQQVTNLVKEIKILQKSVAWGKESAPHFKNDFYLSIASSLQPWQYKKAWLEYQHANFFARFMANDFQLLKRKIVLNENSIQAVDKFRLVETFPFLHKVTVQQPALF